MSRRAEHNRRLSQNQFVGLKEFLPLTFYAGSQYMAYDVGELWGYDIFEQPFLINLRMMFIGMEQCGFPLGSVLLIQSLIHTME